MACHQEEVLMNGWLEEHERKKGLWKNSVTVRTIHIDQNAPHYQSACYNYLRPLHSKERQHASGIPYVASDLFTPLSQNPMREKITGKIQVSGPSWLC